MNESFSEGVYWEFPFVTFGVYRMDDIRIWYLWEIFSWRSGGMNNVWNLWKLEEYLLF